jgi:cysteine-rich repeat protein
VCNADGLGYTDTACSASETCSAGVCAPWVCTPGAFSCLDTNTRRVCNADGLGYTSASCTGSAAFGYACTGAGMCTDRICTPGSASSVCASTTSRQVCNTDGLAYSASACASGQSCTSGVCSVRCGDGVVGTGETCDDGNTVSGDGCSSRCASECDSDGDGYRNTSCGGRDCDDADAAIHPFAGDRAGDTADTDCDGYDCEAGYSGTVYLTFCVDRSSQVSASEANSRCLASGYDGLAIPLNAAENAAIAALGASMWATHPLASYNVRIGGNDALVEGQWRHDRTGALLTYRNFLYDSGMTSRNCINLIGDPSYSGGWQDATCASPFNLIYGWSCESRP